MNEEKSLEKTVKTGLESPTFDLSVDYAELALDAFIDNDAVKEIPIVKSVVGILKGGIKVREMFFAKKLLTFLREFHTGSLGEEKKQKFKSKFNSDTKYRDAVVEQIMVLNDRVLEINKSKILANLFAAHINEKFEWEDFLSLAYCVERLNLTAIALLEEMANLEDKFHKGYSQFDDNAAFLIAAGMAQQWGTHLTITGHGQFVYYYGIKGDINHTFPAPTKNDG